MLRRTRCLLTLFLAVSLLTLQSSSFELVFAQEAGSPEMPEIVLDSQPDTSIPSNTAAVSESVNQTASNAQNEPDSEIGLENDLEALLGPDQTTFGKEVFYTDFNDTRSIYKDNQVAIESVLDLRTAKLTFQGMAGFREGMLAQEGEETLYTYGIIITAPDGADWSADYTDTYEISFDRGVTFQTHLGKEISLDGTSVKMYWENVALLRDGTACDMELTLSNFVLRLLPEQTVKAGNQYLIMYSQVQGSSQDEEGNPVIPENATVTSPGPCASLWLPDGTGEIEAAVCYDITYSVIPRDGRTIASHGADKMVYFFYDLDCPDSADSGYLGPYSESIEFREGLIGPVYISNATYQDLYEYSSLERDHGSSYEEQATSYTAWYDESGTKIVGLYGDDAEGRPLNVERIESSKGTWYSASHKVSSSSGHNQSADVGAIAIVDPTRFTIRWRGCMI